MKVPAKIVCDICGKPIEFITTKNWVFVKGQNRFISCRQHYEVKLITSQATDCTSPKREKQNVDICKSCFSKMSTWIRSETEES